MARFRAALGEPMVLVVEGGLEIYRGKLERPMGLTLHVTLDSPERPDICHVIISDPRSRSVEPVVSVTARTPEEVDAMIAGILKQWKAE